MRVTEDGRVTIPREVREELGIQPGDEVSFERSEAGYVLRKRVHTSRFEKWRGVASSEECVEARLAELRSTRER